MAQIAQQDHLFVTVENIEERTLTDEQKATLKAKYKEGTLLDVVLKDGYTTSKILSYDVDPDTDTLELISFAFGNVLLSASVV